PENPDSRRHRCAWIARALGGAAVLLALVAVAYLAAPVPKEVHAEGGPVEWGEFAAWVLAVLASGLALARSPTRRDRLDALWIHTLAWLATARELDLHERINPEAMGRWGRWGVRFRADWWLDAGAPLGPKLLWGMVALALVGLLALPPLLVRAPGLALARRCDPPTVLFLLACALLAGGYLSDDLLRHPGFMHEEHLQGIEEALELLGAWAFAASAGATLRRPLTVRLADVGLAA
ncbi:MAG TPA: hypothetical protein VD963_00890, partial [Phycisphaerales bacterium]|nr:hypothetical protein [Phycisphaerales bacterium]